MGPHRFRSQAPLHESLALRGQSRVDVFGQGGELQVDHRRVAPHPLGEGGRPGPEAGVEGVLVELFAPQADLTANDLVLVEAVLLPGAVVVDLLPGLVGVAGAVACLSPAAEAAVQVPAKKEEDMQKLSRSWNGYWRMSSLLRGGYIHFLATCTFTGPKSFVVVPK